MEDFFGPEGILNARLPNFEYRRQQRELAEKIENFLQSDRHLLAAEAPTGVGKTYAMLIPAMRWAVANNSTVLVLTSGITLQEQLIYKDIPALLDVLGLDLPYGLLKGRGNYACIRKAREIGAEGFLDFGGDKGQASRDISGWLYATETGDLSELSLGDAHPARERIASSYLTCLGPYCPHHDRCFYNKVMRNLSRWRIIVANYHVYFSYVLGQRKPFPVPFGLLICDEAHKMEEAARSVTQRGVDARDWQRLLRRAPRLDKVEASLLRSVDCAADRFAEEVADLSHVSESVFAQLAVLLPDGKGFTAYPPELKNDTAELLVKCDRVIGHLNDLQEAASSGGDANPLQDDGKISVWNGELTEFRDSLRWCCDTQNYPEWAYWREGGSLKSSCVNGGDLIPPAFDDEEVKVIALSATMTVDHSFEYWANETGLAPDETAVLDSPFDLPSLMEIDVVDLGLQVMSPGYADAVSRVCRKYARENGGATLILLSSRRLLTAVSAYLKMHAEKDKLNILVQGDLPRTELLELFKENERSVLVGMASFREGIDVPGEARAKLEGRENFVKAVLPGAKMQLRQAAGRLVRTGSDRGRVVILDGRIVTRPDWKILDSLPAVPVKKYRLVGVHK